MCFLRVFLICFLCVFLGVFFMCVFRCVFNVHVFTCFFKSCVGDLPVRRYLFWGGRLKWGMEGGVSGCGRRVPCP